MATCNNCKTSMGCSCQVRIANNGARCCDKCVTAYNKKHPVQPKEKGSEIAPTNVKVTYNGPGKQLK